jgi:NTE family protein
VPRTAFVLGGGGLLGAAEAGMARALLEASVKPDLILGTSVGAINGAVIATDPAPETAQRLVAMWDEMGTDDVLGGSALGRLGQLLRTRTSLHSNAALRELLERFLPTRFDQLAVEFQCVAASIERASERWFSTGELVDAVVASAALPGVFPAVEIDGEHYLDGGLVNSIPIARAVDAGAEVIYVLHVGRVESPLRPPRLPWEVGFVAFEVARRHRFHRDLATLPEGVAVHVLPTGLEEPVPSSWSNLRYRDRRRIGDRTTTAYEATAAYLAGLEPGS